MKDWASRSDWWTEEIRGREIWRGRQKRRREREIKQVSNPAEK